MSEGHRLNPGKVKQLLDKLCREMGLCSLPDDVVEKLIFNPPSDIEGFVEFVFSGEGLDAKFRGPLYRQVKDRVAELFANSD
ncbi:MAG: hypothetical protein WD845_04635 [Pirellulales bacterium]